MFEAALTRHAEVLVPDDNPRGMRNDHILSHYREKNSKQFFEVFSLLFRTAMPEWIKTSF